MYPPILLAWTWLLLSTTYALPIATSPVDRSDSLNDSSQLNDFVHTSTPAQFDDDPATLFKRAPTRQDGQSTSSSSAPPIPPGSILAPGVHPPPGLYTTDKTPPKLADGSTPGRPGYPVGSTRRPLPGPYPPPGLYSDKTPPEPADDSTPGRPYYPVGPTRLLAPAHQPPGPNPWPPSNQGRGR